MNRVLHASCLGCKKHSVLVFAVPEKQALSSVLTSHSMLGEVAPMMHTLSVRPGKAPRLYPPLPSHVHRLQLEQVHVHGDPRFMVGDGSLTLGVWAPPTVCSATVEDSSSESKDQAINAAWATATCRAWHTELGTDDTSGLQAEISKPLPVVHMEFAYFTSSLHHPTSFFEAWAEALTEAWKLPFHATFQPQSGTVVLRVVPPATAHASRLKLHITDKSWLRTVTGCPMVMEFTDENQHTLSWSVPAWQQVTVALEWSPHTRIIDELAMTLTHWMLHDLHQKLGEQAKVRLMGPNADSPPSPTYAEYPKVQALLLEPQCTDETKLPQRLLDVVGGCRWFNERDLLHMLLPLEERDSRPGQLLGAPSILVCKATEAWQCRGAPLVSVPGTGQTGSTTATRPYPLLVRARVDGVTEPKTPVVLERLSAVGAEPTTTLPLLITDAVGQTVLTNNTACDLVFMAT